MYKFNCVKKLELTLLKNSASLIYCHGPSWRYFCRWCVSKYVDVSCGFISHKWMLLESPNLVRVMMLN